MTRYSLLGSPTRAIFLVIVILLVGTGVVAARQSGWLDDSRSVPNGGKVLTDIAGDTQRATLADGAVDRAEYEAAVDATIACLRAAGIEVRGPHAEGDRLAFTFHSPDRSAHDQALVVYNQCYEEHQIGVDQAWANVAEGGSE